MVSAGSLLRIGIGLIWLIDAYFKWLPGFRHGFMDILRQGAENQPGWLKPWFDLQNTLVSGHPTPWVYAVALIETVLAVCLIIGLARKSAYTAGLAWSLVIWATAEGFGNPGQGAPWTDVGTGLAYGVIFLLLLALDARSGENEPGTRSLSIDAAIEKKHPRWR